MNQRQVLSGRCFVVKLLCMALILTGCTAAGLIKAQELKRRKQLLLDFKDLILHISTEISYFKEPLPHIFERLAAADLSKEGEEDTEICLLLRNCLAAYSTEQTDMGRLWKNAVDFVYEELPVTREDTDIMKKCGDFLGQSDFAGQQDHFRLLNGQLDRQIRQAEDAAETKGRMYSRMGLSLGMVLTIALI